MTHPTCVTCVTWTAQDRAVAKRVMSERDILVKANHPFVVKLFFCFQVTAVT